MLPFCQAAPLTASCCCSGPVNPAFFAVNPAAQYDSFLTIGMDGPALTPGALSSVGLDFSTWDETTPLDVTAPPVGGAVFLMDPSSGPSGTVVLAQLTVAGGTAGSAVMGVQGQSTTGEDWQHDGVIWSWDGSASATPPPPPPERLPAQRQVRLVPQPPRQLVWQLE